MSPRSAQKSASAASSSRNASAPYSRRSVAQPKSTRQQFSACGACRMRRVRCDLKDLDYVAAGPHPTCSNCKERGIKCVDEFADVKSVKLLRRGRRLQQVEAIYGKTADKDNNSTHISCSIPALQPEFFYSQFWRWFCIQRPILDTAEFSSRFLSHHQGERSFGPEASIITVLLVVWAFSFGLNERGVPINDDTEDNRPSSGGQDAARGDSPDRDPTFSQQRHRCRETTEGMVQQILELVDHHGILRRPSLDGIRVLLLLLPLIEDVKPLERQTIHDATLLQVQSLCTQSPSLPSGPGTSHISAHTFDDATVRARLFWYAYTQEGLLSGSRGSRLVLNSDDYDAFQRSLPMINFNFGSLPSPSSPCSPQVAIHQQPEAHLYNRLISSSTLPSQLNMICRRIHAVLTGPKAAKRAEDHKLIDAHGMREIWNDLDRCWREFSVIRRNTAANDDPTSRCDTERYACAWQIFIFECQNTIREALRQYSSSTSASSSYPNGSTSRPSSVSSTSPYLSPQYLQVVAARKCRALLPKVIRILKYCTSSPHNSARSGLFVWDSGLVRDGCFFAGYLAASAEEDILDPPLDGGEQNESEPAISPITTDEGVMVCLSALSAMRWSFSKSEEREETIRMVWEARKAKRRGQPAHYPDISFDATYLQASDHANDVRLQPGLHPTNRVVLSATSYLDRPMLPALSVFSQSRRAESAPSTACTTDGQGIHGWPTYTPPGTGTSLTTSTGTGLSARGSPEFANTLPTFKHHSDEGYYQGGGDLSDHFTYNVPLNPPHPADMAPAMSTYPPRHSSLDGHGISNTIIHAASYIPPNFSSGSGPMVASGNDYTACPQFGDNCNAPYH